MSDEKPYLVCIFTRHIGPPIPVTAMRLDGLGVTRVFATLGTLGTYRDLPIDVSHREIDDAGLALADELCEWREEMR